MSRGHLIEAFLLSLTLAGCDRPVQLADGESYRIPAENNLQNASAANYVRFVYGRSDAPGEIGVVFSGKEVAEAVPGFKAQVQGYVGPVDAAPSVVVTTLNGQAFDKSLHDNLTRLRSTTDLPKYRDTNFGIKSDGGAMFSLLQRDGGWSRTDLIPPGCTRSPNQDGSRHYDSCLFSVRRGRHVFSFWLSGENVAYADQFVAFVIRKLGTWKVSPGQ